MTNTCRFVLFCALLFALMPVCAHAHGDFHTVITEVNKLLEASPTNAELYIRRGELYRTHQNWDSAYADFDHAAALNPKLDVVDFVRGRLFLEADWPQSAKRVLDRFISRQPNHSEAHIVRARVNTRLSNHVASAQDYTRAIALSAQPGPELFIERAQTLTAAGEDHFAEALRGLDEGIKKLGPLVTLQLYAVDVELKQKHFDAALERVDKLAAASPRKETWLARRGEILQQAGKPAEAREAFKSALAAMDKLPPTRRNVPAMMELEKRLREQLANTPPGSSKQP